MNCNGLNLFRILDVTQHNFLKFQVREIVKSQTCNNNYLIAPRRVRLVYYAVNNLKSLRMNCM